MRLLLEFETLAREAGWVCNDVEEVGSGDFRQTFAELAYQMLLSMSRRERMRARAPAALREVEYEAPAVELILEASAGYPHFIQEYGRVLWNEVENSPITARDIQGAQALVTEALSRRFFRDRFEMASDAEQRYLAAMADLDDGAVRSADVATRAGYKDRGSTSVLRESLLRKDLVYSPRRGFVDFTVPLFAAYLREQHPLASFTDDS